MRTSTATSRRTKVPKRVLALPDLEQSKAAVLNTLTSASGQRTYDHAIREFVAWESSRLLEVQRRLSLIWTLVEPSATLTDCRDPDDNRVLECAIESGASHIVTGDRALLAP